MEGYMKDSKGRMVPEDMVKPIDKTRDQLVKEIVGKAQVVAAELARFKAGAMADIKAFIDLSMDQYQVNYGGTKGNVTLTSYDGEFQVVLAVADRLAFDERLHAAKALIDECLANWTEGARSELKVLIDDAFQVDKAGKINTGRVLRLRRSNIKDPKWLRAMEAIQDSITVTESKEYIRIYRRNKDGDYDLVNLDVAA